MEYVPNVQISQILYLMEKIVLIHVVMFKRFYKMDHVFNVLTIQGLKMMEKTVDQTIALLGRRS